MDAPIKQTKKNKAKKLAVKSVQLPSIPAKKKQAAKPKPEQTKKMPSFPRIKLNSLLIVGIGASAGGLKPLETFFDNMPSDSGISFVVIQHLSPDHKSIMGSLLQKHTKMKVLAAEDRTKVKPDCIYLNPPDKNIGIINDTLQLIEPMESHAVNLPIDFFFRSLSEDKKERAICIVLSGTGTDGTLGVKAVKAGGGMTMAQEEKEAEYSGMPKSAIDTGLVDYILPVAKIPAQLLRYARHPYLREPLGVTESEKKYDDYVQKIFIQIRSKTGHDFSHYKKNTIHRRIERRMAVHQIARIEDYVRMISDNPSEIKTLFRDMLITVTNFFRDPDAFKILAGMVVPELLKNSKNGSVLRVWEPGCATGEEAYSLAILLAESMEKLKKHMTVQIFATDIDEAAIEYARKAVYPDSIAADVSSERLKNFFIKEENAYRIKKQIREMVLFANQSLTKDPPFSKLDMVVCRNVLIYMDTELQKKILPLFHYTLNPGGVLFLGPSESIGGFLDYFDPIDTKWKIFKCKNTVMPKHGEYHRDVPAVAIVDDQNKEKVSLPHHMDIRDIAERLILDNYSPPCVLINSKYDILYFSGNTDKYLSPPAGEPDFNILKMVHANLSYRLRAALNKVAQQKTTFSYKGLQIQQQGKSLSVDLTVMPVSAKTGYDDMMMVVFEDKTPHETEVKVRKAGKPKKDAPSFAALEQELKLTRDHLQTTIEEHDTTNEELKSTNEELQSTNEELQSTNEELETSKEEMQSTNEELVTVNAELQTKIDELSSANNDLNNLIASTEIATIFLDINLRIKRFTSSVEKIFNLIRTDVGRQISDLTAKTRNENIFADSEKVLRTLNTVEKNIRVESGEIFNMRIMPYRTTENVINGVVLTFTDITRIIKAEEDKFLASVLKNSNDAITMQDAKGNILVWNRGAVGMYGYTEAEALTMNICETVPDTHKKEALQLVKDAFAGKTINAFKTKRKTKDGKILDVWLSVTTLRDANGAPVSLATTERNITELARLL